MDAFEEIKIRLSGIRWEASRVRAYMAEYRRHLAAGVDLNGNPIDEAGRAWLESEIADEEPRIEELRRKFERVQRHGLTC